MIKSGKKLLLKLLNRKSSRHRVASLTLIEMLLVIALVAGLSSVIMLPTWRGWKNLELKHQQKQVHDFFQSAHLLMMMSKSDLVIVLSHEDDKERLIASGYFLDPRYEKINLTLEKGFQLSLLGKQAPSWILSSFAPQEEIVLRLEDASGRFVQWNETLHLMENI